MKLWVLYEDNNDSEQGGEFHNVHGIFNTKERALQEFENIEFNYYCDEYEKNLDELCSIIEKNSQILKDNGEVGFYHLILTDYYV